MNQDRRKFIQNTLALSLGLPVLSQNLWSHSLNLNDNLKISLQCYSFASSLFRNKMKITDFPKIVREDFNIDAAEYWNRPMVEKRRDSNFIRELNKRTNDYGLKILLLLLN